jgi:catechol 2,3-dioxygenase-like lactoylglutathione lyase family enzyme
VLRTLGIVQTGSDDHYTEWDDFSLAPADSEEGVTSGLHVAFVAPAREHVEEFFVDAFHRAATAAGYRGNGAPGERTVYHDGYYGAFVLDPDGNNVEVVNHNR